MYGKYSSALLAVLAAILVLTTGTEGQPEKNLAYSMFRWTWMLTSAVYQDTQSNFVLGPFTQLAYLNELYGQGDDKMVNMEIEKTLSLKASGYDDASQLQEDIRRTFQNIADETTASFMTFYQKDWPLKDKFKRATHDSPETAKANIMEADFSTETGRQDVLDKLNAAIAEVDTEPSAIKKAGKALSSADKLVQGGAFAGNLQIKAGFVPAKNDSFVGRFYNLGAQTMVTMKYGLKRMTIPHKLDEKLKLHIVGIPLKNDWYVFFNVPVELDGLKTIMVADNVDQYVGNFISGVYPAALDIYVPFSEKANSSCYLKPAFQETGIKAPFEKSAKLKFFNAADKSACLANIWARGDHHFLLEDISLRTVHLAEFHSSGGTGRAYLKPSPERAANLSTSDQSRATPLMRPPAKPKQAPGTIRISGPDHLAGQKENDRLSPDNRANSDTITIVPDHPYSYIVLDNYNIPIFSGVVQVGRPAADNNDQSWPN
ncbi:hypothetical protein HDE_03853 [Halotydeus destructor]|nr:hypothetical protein HDE_03853 [Halotydeus destructor]